MRIPQSFTILLAVVAVTALPLAGLTALVGPVALALASVAAVALGVPAAIVGGAAGPWITGLLHDHTGNYAAAFWIALGLSIVSAIGVSLASV